MDPASRGAPPGYHPRRPEAQTLHRLLSEHLETLLARAADDPDRPGLPAFVERELRAYRSCGLLSGGFARVFCPACSRSILVAFSFKGRGFCPSCCGRRMAKLAAHLTTTALEAIYGAPRYPRSDRALAGQV